MKKLLALAFVMCSLGIANAQIVRSTTFNKVPKEKTKTTWYVRAGVSLNNMTGEGRSNLMKEIKDEGELADGEKAGFTTRAGYDFEVGFKKNFGKSDMYWGMQLGFGTRGGGFVHKYYGHYYGDKVELKETSDLDLYTIKYTPFQFGYMYPINEDISLDAHLGVFLSFDLGGSMKDKDIVDGKVEDDWKYSYGETDCVPFDAGIQLGIGAWYKKFNLDVSWQRGFVKMVGDFPYNDDNFGDIKSSNFVIALGYAF